VICIVRNDDSVEETCMRLAAAATRFIDPSLATLLFLLMALALVLLAGAAIASLLANRRRFAGRMALGLLGIEATYVALVVSVSLSHPGAVLPRGERLAFTGFYVDPHLQIAIADVRFAESLGSGAARREARGTFAIVTVELSSTARGAMQKPNALSIALTDDSGLLLSRDLAAEQALASETGELGALEREIAPHRSYTRAVVFDVPRGARAPRLLAIEGLEIDHFLELWIVGDDDALGHRRTTLSLGLDPAESGMVAGRTRPLRD
jgi:hypothetical protein